MGSNWWRRSSASGEKVISSCYPELRGALSAFHMNQAPLSSKRISIGVSMTQKLTLSIRLSTSYPCGVGLGHGVLMMFRGVHTFNVFGVKSYGTLLSIGLTVLPNGHGWVDAST